MEEETTVPEGRDFLQLIWDQEDECEIDTDSRLSELGKKAPKCLEYLGTVLSHLDRMSSCWWGCRGGDHRIEYLCGRATSNARASLRLVRFGFYDEVLVLSRGLGEIANLMQLFVCDPGSFNEWKNASPTIIRKEFSPVKVRVKIESTTLSPIINKDRYGLLSERATHVHPETTPQMHNVYEQPVAGAKLQDAGILICMNELALPICIIALYSAKLLNIENTISMHIMLSARRLAEQLGGINITTIDEYLKMLVCIQLLSKMQR